MDKLSHILEHSLYIYIVFISSIHFYNVYRSYPSTIMFFQTLSSAPTPSLIKNFVINSLKSYCIIHM